MFIKDLEHACDTIDSEFSCAHQDWCSECAINDMLKDKEKYRWHDLRKDPNDLPEYGKLVVAWILEQSAVYNGYVISTSASYIHSYAMGVHNNLHEVIAWRYIEPFEEEEQNAKLD